MTPRSRPLASLLLVAALAAAPSARAEDKAGAAALFTEAGRLVDAGQAAAACPKYEESLRLYDGLNTRYFLADCYARVGRAATAWALFNETAARAAAAGDADKESWARERAAAVKPQVSTLTVSVAHTTSTPTITRDGAPLGSAQWAVAMPVDPGEHAIEASAPGKRPWSARVVVAPNGASARVDVPELEDASPEERAAAAVPLAPSANDDARARRRTLAVVVGGAGIVAIGVGAVLGLSAKGTFDDASASCNGDRCNQQGLDLRSSAVTRADVATVVFGVGVAGVATGAVLWLTAPPDAGRASIGVAPMLGGAAVKGTF